MPQVEDMVDGGTNTLAAALARPRYELIPLRGAEKGLSHLPQGEIITVTCSAKAGLEPTLAFSTQARAHGLHVVPHIAARHVRDARHLREILDRLTDGGITEIFVPAGDRQQPVGDFDSAYAMLRVMHDLPHNMERIGITGYPEGHPLINDERLQAALAAKQPFADYIVSQMCFSGETLARWIREIRGRGIHLPVYLGIPGIANRQKLMRISLRIGVGASIRFLTKNRDFMRRFFTPGGSDAHGLVLEMLPHMADPGYGIAGLHIYTFNEVQTSVDWHRTLMKESMARV